MEIDKDLQANLDGFQAAVARAIFEQSAIGMCTQTLDGRYLQVNPAMCEITGRTEEELRSLRWVDVVDPAFVERAGDWQAALHPGVNLQGELDYIKPDGTRVPTTVFLSVIEGNRGEPACVYVQSVVADLFNRMNGSDEGAAAITVSILSALDSLGEGVMIIDPATRSPLFINSALTQINGYTRSDLEALPGGLFSTLDPPQAAELQERLRRRLAGEDVPNHYEVDMARKDGRRIKIEVAVQLIPGNTDLLVAIVRDVTERARMQERSERTERIHAMGQMASGTAHDFNNLLTSILGEVDLVLDSMDADRVEWGEVHRGIEDIRETAELGARLAKRLLSIGTSRGLTVQTVDVREVIEKLEPVLVRVISDKARLEMELCEDDCRAQLFPDELEQVVLNLVLNASDALADGGSIKIETTHDSGERIELAVSDDGPGIPPEVQANMFEPYFTTKGSGRGTGLGLSVVDAIVTRAGGSIAVETALGKGTRVAVSFPAARSGDSDKT